MAVASRSVASGAVGARKRVAGASTPFEAQRQAIINGLVSAQSETNGWNAQVVPNIPVGNVVRTSDTVVTITLPAVPGYDITAQEVITATIPAAALTTSADPIDSSPTFTVDQVATFQAAWAIGSNSIIQGGIQ